PLLKGSPRRSSVPNVFVGSVSSPSPAQSVCSPNTVQSPPPTARPAVFKRSPTRSDLEHWFTPQKLVSILTGSGGSVEQTVIGSIHSEVKESSDSCEKPCSATTPAPTSMAIFSSDPSSLSRKPGRKRKSSLGQARGGTEGRSDPRAGGIVVSDDE